MTERDFVYWLNGHVELNPMQDHPTPAQWKMIKEHLALVMTKVTPDLIGKPFERFPPITRFPPSTEPPYKVTCESSDLSTRKLC